MQIEIVFCLILFRRGFLSLWVIKRWKNQLQFFFSIFAFTIETIPLLCIKYDGLLLFFFLLNNHGIIRTWKVKKFFISILYQIEKHVKISFISTATILNLFQARFFLLLKKCSTICKGFLNSFKFDCYFTKHPLID